MPKRIVFFFDKLEDKMRSRLSRRPILYAVLGGVGVVLFWRGVWHTADFIMTMINTEILGYSNIDWSGMFWWDGPLSLLVGLSFLLLIGIFVSNFIGNEIIITGLRKEKKLTEKTEAELRTEIDAINDLKDDLHDDLQKISQRLDVIESNKQK